jgi:hypothetical protein
VTVAAAETRPHVSYSALNDWTGCGWYSYLKRVLDLTEKPALWNVGGHAVHEATAMWDLGD